MSMEDNPLSFSDLGVNRNKSREEAQREREVIVAGATETQLAMLEDYEREVLKLLFPSQGQKSSLKQVGGLWGVTREAIRQTRDKAIGKLERLQKGELEIEKRRGRPKIAMNPEIEAKLLQNRHLPVGEHSKMVGVSYKVAKRLRGELGIEKNPEGRPRKSGVSSKQK